MGIGDLVSLRFYLASVALDELNVRMLKRHLGVHQVARTVIWAGMLEAIAAPGFCHTPCAY
jgi:hypothetical protein